MGSLTVIMWVVLTVVTFLTCHLSLGQDVLAGDTVDSIRQNEASEETKLLEPRYECPQNNICFNGNTIADIPGVKDWHNCGEICKNIEGCNFWTWYNNNMCYLKTSDHGLAYDESAMSGEKTCQ